MSYPEGRKPGVAIKTILRIIGFALLILGIWGIIVNFIWEGGIYPTVFLVFIVIAVIGIVLIKFSRKGDEDVGGE